MKKSIVLFLIASLFIGCSNTRMPHRPQVIYSNKDSSFVLIKGNALHWQQRHDYKMRKLAAKNNKIAKN